MKSLQFEEELKPTPLWRELTNGLSFTWSTRGIANDYNRIEEHLQQQKDMIDALKDDLTNTLSNLWAAARIHVKDEMEKELYSDQVKLLMAKYDIK